MGKARAVTALRFDAEMKRRLDEAALANSRSFSEEVRDRLGRSLSWAAEPLEDMAAPDTEAFLMAVRCALDMIEAYSGQPWSRDRWTFDNAKAAIEAQLRFLRPMGLAAFPENAPTLRALRAQGLGALVDQAKVQLERSNLGEMIGKAVIAMAEEGAETRPEVRRLLPFGATLKAMLEANNADQQARAELKAAAVQVREMKP